MGPFCSRARLADTPRRSWRKAAFALTALTVAGVSGGTGAAPDSAAPRFELFSGVGITSDSTFGYVGAAWAFGRDVSEEGWRVKALAGTGRYGYRGALPGIAGAAGFNGGVALARLLAGYQWRRGEWTVKAYAGIGHEDHGLSPADPANSVRGSETGAVGQLELWRNLGAAGFASFDASYADAFGSYWAQARLGRRFGSRFSAGVEGGALGNQEYDSGRGGAFLRYHMRAMDLTVSGGVSGDYYSNDLGGYAAVGLYRKF